MMAERDVDSVVAELAQRSTAPPPPWARMPFYQRLRMRARAAVMAGGLAGVERNGLIARAMPELPFLQRFIPPGCLAVDVGANIGVVASEIARHAGHVLAFEPNPMPFFVLRHLRKSNLCRFGQRWGQSLVSRNLLYHAIVVVRPAMVDICGTRATIPTR